MTVRPRSAASVDLCVEDIWVIEAFVTDSDGEPTADTMTLTVVSPTGDVTSSAMDTVLSETGLYRSKILVEDEPGRWVATVVGVDQGAAGFTAYVSAITTAAQMPDRDALDDYLSPHSFTDAKLDEALAAELANQRRVCRIPAVYEADLRSAIFRRCARHLALLRLPLAMIQGDADVMARVPAWDVEVNRFERPYRKLIVG